MSYRFFLGLGGINATDEVSLNVDDGYLSLPEKTQAMCKWALDHNFDYMYKCDTDTLVSPANLALSFHEFDYMGGENADNVSFFHEPVSFASGGAGYWLSRKAMEIVVNSIKPPTNAEDVFVAWALKGEGISPVWHPGYKWRPETDVDKETVSLHLSSAYQKKYKPEMMLESYAKLKRIQ
jgi:hypothetical protein